jgi:Tfp pilus assembly protein PilZ
MRARDRFPVNGVTCSLENQAMRVTNLSLSGLFAATERPPLEGQIVSLELSLPGRGPFTVVGAVSWINPRERPRTPGLPPGFGFRITKMPLPAKVAILDLLKRSAEASAP